MQHDPTTTSTTLDASDADAAIVGAITTLIGGALRNNADAAYTERLLEVAQSLLAR